MTLTQSIVLAVSAFLCLAIGIILFVILYQRRIINHQIQMREFNREKERELLQATLRGEEEERMRVASELHDDVGATLSSVRLYLQEALQNPDDGSLSAQTKMLLDDGIKKVRDISHQLQSDTLQYLGLIKSLEAHAELISGSGFIQMECMLPADWPEPEAQTALSLYRIIQELVNNITKHAGASRIQLFTHNQDGRHCISISHDGNGLTETEYQKQLFKPGAIGLKNIENRLKSANLTIRFAEPEERNYLITISLPPTTKA